MQRLAVVAALVWLAGAPAQGDEPFGLPLTGEAAETFLREARLGDKKTLDVGITHSQRYTLTDGAVTARAVWKTIDESKPGVTSFQGGGFVVDFADSWKNEVASYELDKLVGTGLVPPTVERTIERVTGSLQLWVEKAKTEADRKRERLEPPDIEAWNRQMYAVRLLHQLTFNTDSRNIRNVLFDPTFRIYAVDFSRAFVPYHDLRAPKELGRFPRAVLEKMRTLDKPLLQEKLGRWLNGRQIDALLARRDKILELASRLVAEQGEDEVLY